MHWCSQREKVMSLLTNWAKLVCYCCCCSQGEGGERERERESLAANAKAYGYLTVFVNYMWHDTPIKETKSPRSFVTRHQIHNNPLTSKTPTTWLDITDSVLLLASFPADNKFHFTVHYLLLWNILLTSLGCKHMIFHSRYKQQNFYIIILLRLSKNIFLIKLFID